MPNYRNSRGEELYRPDRQRSRQELRSSKERESKDVISNVDAWLAGESSEAIFEGCSDGAEIVSVLARLKERRTGLPTADSQHVLSVERLARGALEALSAALAIKRSHDNAVAAHESRIAELRAAGKSTKIARMIPPRLTADHLDAELAQRGVTSSHGLRPKLVEAGMAILNGDSQAMQRFADELGGLAA